MWVQQLIFGCEGFFSTIFQPIYLYNARERRHYPKNNLYFTSDDVAVDGNISSYRARVCSNTWMVVVLGI